MKKLLFIIIIFTLPYFSLGQTKETISTNKTKTSTSASKKTASTAKQKASSKQKTKTNSKEKVPKEKPKAKPSKAEIAAQEKAKKESDDCLLAHENLKKAHQEIDNKQHWTAEELLQKAIVLCPNETIKFKYELAWNYYLMKQYNKAILILDSLTTKPDAPADIYQLLGNAYDELGNENMALITYNKGLAKYPNAGCLFLEKGNLAYKRSNFIGALEQYENGIENDPNFASNYYRSAQIFLSSSEEVWGIMYGEIFMNLEKGGERAVEISRKLYDCYHSEITFNTNQIKVNFNDPTIVYSNSKERPNLFPDNYENALLQACKGQRNINLASLVEIRKRFISNFYRNSPSFKNVLFDYQKKLIDLGLFEAYNYWLFGYGNTQEAASWIQNNKAQFDRFIKWQSENPFSITKENVFSRYKME